MANYCSIYSVDSIPNKDNDRPKTIGISETSYSIPLFGLILVSDKPVLSDSMIWKDVKSITGTYSDAVIDKLEAFLAAVNEKTGKNDDYSSVIAWLRNPANRQEYITLELAEILSMDITGNDLINAKTREFHQLVMNIDSLMNDTLEHPDTALKGVSDEILQQTSFSNDLYYSFKNVNDIEEGTKSWVYNGNHYTWKPEKEHIIVYDDKGSEIGHYDSIQDFKYDLDQKVQTESTLFAMDCP